MVGVDTRKMGGGGGGEGIVCSGGGYVDNIENLQYSKL